MPRSLVIPAYAKINLALSVGPPSPESRGLHPISSWMMTVDLADDLTLTRLERGVLSRYAIVWHKKAKRRNDIDWSLSRDLSVRAHQALEKHLGMPGDLPVQAKLEKRIPVGGGLGGGSADAAAMLRGLNDLFELNLSREELARIGASLGSDVPFLVHGGSAVVEGLGDRITHHSTNETPLLHAVLVFPEATCPTPAVYRKLDELRADQRLRAEDVRALVAQRPRPDSAALFNDLCEPAMHIAPALRDHLQAVSRIAERPAHLSGSGSTIFVMCDDAMHAEALAESIERQLGLPSLAAATRCP